MNIDIIKHQTIQLRHSLKTIFSQEKERAQVMPPGWKNNMYWHLGHLVAVPELITHGMLGEEMRVPAEYRELFGARTMPADWGERDLPDYDELLEDLSGHVEGFFDEFTGRLDDKFPESRTIGIGVEFRNIADTVTFSSVHDGIHLGMVMALKRDLDLMK
jgi:hypothetical protein